MYTVFVVLHVMVCLVLCVVVLLQSSKGGGLAGAFGGSGGMPQQIFGTRGMTTILHKITIYCAVGFFLTSATLFALTAQRNRAPRSVVQEAASQGTLTSDVTPPAPAEDLALPPLTGDDLQPSNQDAATPDAPPVTGDADGGQSDDDSSDQ
jgi:preprotein translocase subunit SecG